MLDAEESVHPEGPGNLAVVWSDDHERRLSLEVIEAPARLLRVEFDRGPNDLVLGDPYLELGASAAAAQQAHPPSATDITEFAASQHGPLGASMASSVRVPPQVGLEVGQPGVELAEPGDALGKLVAASGDDLGQRQVVVSVQWPEWHQPAICGGHIERHVHPAQVDEQPQVLDLS